jgi:hypothetical protein
MAGSIYGRSSVKIANFVPIRYGSFGQTVSEEKNFKNQPIRKKESSVAAMFVNGLGRNEQSLQRTFHRCFQPSFRSFGQPVSEEKNFK